MGVRRWVGFVGLAAALAGCAGGGSGGGGGAPLRLYADFDPTSTAPRACDALTLSASSGAPLDTITISGLPGDMPAIAVYLETVADGVGVLYPAGPVAGRQAQFLVPVGPDADPDGGDVMLTVTDGDEACPAVPFTIGPLPAAPADYGTYMSDLADAMQEFLDLLAQVFGTDYATLSAADAPPAEGLVAVFVAVKVFDAALKSPPDLESDADRDLVVRLLTQADALAILADASADLAQWLTDHGSFKVAVSPSSKPETGRAATARRAGEGCAFVDPPTLAIPDTETLSAIMSDRTLGALGDVSKDLRDFTGAMSGISAHTGGLGLSGPTDVLGALGTAAGTVVDFVMAAAPSAFTSLTFDAESPIWEDQTVPPPAWSNAQAHVTSAPFNLSRATLDNLLALAGMSPIGGYAITVITYSFEDEVNAALDDVTDPDGPLCVTVPAQQWGPFDVTSSLWSNAEIIGDTITRTTHQNYVPARLGQSKIRVEVRSDKFGGATIPAQNPVLVEAKTVSISPISPKVDAPGDPVHLMVSINAHFPEGIDFTAPTGAGAVSHVYEGGGLHTFDFASPGSETQFPAPFRAESTSDEVPPDTFARADTVNILLNTGALEITGERGCITPGETVDLEALLTGFDDPDSKTVTWTESAGSTTTGTDTRLATYMAPGTLGTVTVRAETPVSGSEEPAADEVQMEVSDRCLQQFFGVFNQSQADGDPDCEGPLGSRTDLGEEAVDIAIFPPEFTTPEELVLSRRVPVPDAPYFSGAPVTLTTESSFIESIPVGADTCVTTTPSARTDVSIESGGDSAHWEAHFDNSGTCYQDEFLEYCNVGRSLLWVDHYMYLPIEEPGTYQLTMDLACTLYPNFGGVYLTMSRYIDGGGFPQPPNADQSPMLPRNVLLEFDCVSTPETRTVTLDLVGPLGGTGTDLLTIGYQGAPGGYLDGLTPEEIQENGEALDARGKGPSPTFLFDMEVDVRLEKLD